MVNSGTSIVIARSVVVCCTGSHLVANPSATSTLCCDYLSVTLSPHLQDISRYIHAQYRPVYKMLKVGCVCVCRPCIQAYIYILARLSLPTKQGPRSACVCRCTAALPLLFFVSLFPAPPNDVIAPAAGRIDATCRTSDDAQVPVKKQGRQRQTSSQR